MNILKYSRILTLWFCINIILYNVLNNNYSIKIGPNNGLIFMGICINTKIKYVLLYFYIIIKTIMININNEILHPWIILNVQNQNKCITSSLHCYEITIISNLYGWFDWFSNLKLLLSQLDITIFSVFIDVVSNAFVIKYYLKQKSTGTEENDRELTNLI